MEAASRRAGGDGAKQVSHLRSVVLPAYNEEGSIVEMIGRTVAALEQRSDPFEILVVDNASRDRTVERVESLARSDPRLRVVRHSENRLYAGSCMTGTKASRGDRVFILDSDGQYPPEAIWAFDARLDQGDDLVFGYRVERHEPVFRLLMSKVLLWLARYYLAFPLRDVNCGMRAFGRAYADALEIRHTVNLVNPELFVRARLGGFRIGEAPVTQSARTAGASSHDFRRLFRIYLDVTSYLRQLSSELTQR